MGSWGCCHRAYCSIVLICHFLTVTEDLVGLNKWQGKVQSFNKHYTCSFLNGVKFSNASK